MIRHSSMSPVQAALLGCAYLLFGASNVSAQSGGTDPAECRIFLIEPKGALKVKQRRRLPRVNATEGMLVRHGHMLILDATARAAVVCGDGKRRELAPGRQGCPCVKPCTPDVCGINYRGSKIGATRGPDTEAGLFPVVVSPRKTMLRNLRPAIRWTPVAGAKESTIYNVTLYGDGMKVIWTKDVVSETRLTYPDKEPPLAPGQNYKVVVTANGLSSQQEDSPGLGFTTLTPDQSQVLDDEVVKRKQMGFPEAQTRFLVANLYAAKELYSEAIEQVEALYTTMKEPAVATMLGDLYAVVGLNRQSEKSYLAALHLTPSGDLDGVGTIQKNLAQVYENLGDFDRAIASLAKARKAYQRLRNRAMVMALLNDERRLKESGRRK